MAPKRHMRSDRLEFIGVLSILVREMAQTAQKVNIEGFISILAKKVNSLVFWMIFWKIPFPRLSSTILDLPRFWGAGFDDFLEDSFWNAGVFLMEKVKIFMFFAKKNHEITSEIHAKNNPSTILDYPRIPSNCTFGWFQVFFVFNKVFTFLHDFLDFASFGWDLHVFAAMWMDLAILRRIWMCFSYLMVFLDVGRI